MKNANKIKACKKDAQVKLYHSFIHTLYRRQLILPFYSNDDWRLFLLVLPTSIHFLDRVIITTHIKVIFHVVARFIKNSLIYIFVFFLLSSKWPWIQWFFSFSHENFIWVINIFLKTATLFNAIDCERENVYKRT